MRPMMERILFPAHANCFRRKPTLTMRLILIRHGASFHQVRAIIANGASCPGLTEWHVTPEAWTLVRYNDAAHLAPLH